MIERQVKLIELLRNNQGNYLKSDDIASFLNVSNKTTRTDIKIINSQFMEDIIISIKSKGYILNTERYNLEDIDEKLADYLNKNEKLLIKIAYQMLMYEQSITISQLINQFKITKKEVIDYIYRIQMWCEKFDVIIEIKKKKGVFVRGSETDINNAILHLNQLSNQNHRVEDLILHELPQAHIDTIKHIIEDKLSNHGIHTSYLQIEQLIIHLILILKRQFISEKSWHISDEALIISNEVISDINKRLRYRLSHQTAQLFSFFISYHFNKFELGFEKVFIESYIQQLITKMEQKMNIRFSSDIILKDNLFAHFSRTYLRIIKEVYINNPLTSEIKVLYPYVFNVLYDIIQQLSYDSGIELSEDEIAFLTLHFQASIDRNEVSQINVAICCYYGLGISQLLETKISKLNQYIKVTDILKLEDIESYHFENVDILITTHDISAELQKNLEIIKVSPLFSDEDKLKLNQIVKTKLNPIIKENDLDGIAFNIISNDFILSIPGVFEKANQILDESKAITDDYIETALNREKASSTYIGNSMTMPHGDPEKVLKSQVIIFKSDEGFYWKEHHIKIIFFLAISKNDIHLMKQMMQNLALLNEVDVQRLAHLNKKEFENEILNIIKG
ncbi:BglG family transcription antiterminator [Staphylococcus pasteuri]|uniref:BglG family transcription antiterminator n=1 Tax=Staphylococcus pasteuri TaxID=45972 RepID=UPI000E3A16D6|nr:PTS sugar transporter subunit IIA [Staphylococcus pasteuri]RFD67020.1 PTS mannose transporter subunit IIA [Staphylococcus pasteuri]